MGKMIIISMLVIAMSPMVAITQDKIINEPIVSDIEADTTKALRIVPKDEIQRISDDSVLRVQKMEKDIRILKSQITHLQSQIKELEKKVEGG